MLEELKRIQRDFPNAHLRYNAETGKEFICFFSEAYYNSLLIVKK